MPVAGFCGFDVVPSGAVITTLSKRIGTWSGKYSVLDTAASTVIHGSLPASTVDEGTSHCLCAMAENGSAAAMTAARIEMRFMGCAPGRVRFRAWR